MTLRRRSGDRIRSRPGDLRVLVRGDAKHADGTDDAAVCHDGEAALGEAGAEGQHAQANAAVVRSLLAGEAGPVRDAVLLNAAAGLVAYDLQADGPLTDRMKLALGRAAESIGSGAATAVLEKWVSLSQA